MGPRLRALPLLPTVLCALLWCAAAAGAELRAWPDGWFSQEAAIMGTNVRVELQAESEAAAAAAVDAVLAELRRIDATYTTWQEDSDLSRVNREAGQGATSVSAELAALLAESRRVSVLTDGAFDITYASAGRLYDYRRGERPDDSTLEAAIDAIDYRYVELDEGALTVRYAHPGVYVDLGGIAKGFAVDQGLAILSAHGIVNGAVAAGGDMRLMGERRGQPWIVGVRSPDSAEVMVAKLPLTDVAVSTSGDYERFFDEDGIRFHHILDPQTGDSARRLRSVTVIGERAVVTDALSTSVFVLGPELGLALIDRLPDVDALIVDNQGRMLVSEGLRQAR